MALRSDREHPSNMVELLSARAQSHGDRTAMVFLERGEREVGRASYADLDRSARIVGSVLRDAGAASRPVIVALPAGIDFIRCFLGCLYAGAYAVPVPYPLQRRHWDRIEGIARAAKPAAIITDRTARDASDSIGEWGGQILTVPEVFAGSPLASVPNPSGSTLAFIQYTSGSTGKPKGVAVTHGNVMANQAMIAEGFGHTEALIVANWLPLHHDMGLIGCILQPLFIGGLSVFMSPLAFLQRPSRWLKAISDWRATTAGAPNFGYDLCVRAVGEEQIRGIDLSSLKVAFCGAEPVRPRTMRAFAAKFAPHGFDPAALYPCYGQAEATLFVSGRNAGSGLRTHSADRESTGERGVAGARELVSCGWPRMSCEVLIVGAGDAILPEGVTGEICVGGDNVSRGFWSHEIGAEVPDDARELRIGGKRYLRSGDLGFISDGEIYIAGRLKDMLIIHGANIYAEDVEETVMSLSKAALLRSTACFGIEREHGEAMVIVCELAQKSVEQAEGAALLKAATSAIGEDHGTTPTAALLVARGTIPTTASGKIQRSRLRERFLRGELAPLLATGVLPAEERAGS
jgi:acyl-CoA synthetase (AMP-forming)/AMP-acid ligase II